jgi:uncharacterized membrane protein
MANIQGSKTVEIDAPIQEVFDVAADIANAPRWQEAMDEVTVLEHDGEGRPSLVETKGDAGPQKVKITLRFTYDEPTGITWERTKGDLKTMHGSWTLEDLGGDRTRATYQMDGDPGRVLGMLIRGPIEAQLRTKLIDRAAEGLKKDIEG